MRRVREQHWFQVQSHRTTLLLVSTVSKAAAVGNQKSKGTPAPKTGSAPKVVPPVKAAPAKAAPAKAPMMTPVAVAETEAKAPPLPPPGSTSTTIASAASTARRSDSQDATKGFEKLRGIGIAEGPSSRGQRHLWLIRQRRARQFQRLLCQKFALRGSQDSVLEMEVLLREFQELQFQLRLQGLLWRLAQLLLLKPSATPTAVGLPARLEACIACHGSGTLPGRTNRRLFRLLTSRPTASSAAPSAVAGAGS